jgi:ubiquinone/menaquinone biosynthesis C-methylase UbiE
LKIIDLLSYSKELCFSGSPKYQNLERESLHLASGFDALSRKQWEDMCNQFLSLIDINANHDVLDVGCGAGAFLKNIKNYHSLSGVDYIKSSIEYCRSVFDGNFEVAQASQLPFTNYSFDKILCWSVFFYFENLDYAEQSLNEMLRTLKSGGNIFIGDINDQEKEDLYHSIRRKELRDEKRIVKGSSPKHLFYKKSFFKNYAKKHDLQFKIIDEDKMNLPYYSSSKYRFSIIFQKK